MLISIPDLALQQGKTPDAARQSGNKTTLTLPVGQKKRQNPPIVGLSCDRGYYFAKKQPAN